MKNQPGVGCALPQDLRYYILRDDSIMVPMIPADRLPFRLPGVPRQLNHQQMSSECWKYLAEPGKVPPKHAIQEPFALKKPHFRAPDHQVRIDQHTTSVGHVARPSKQSPSPTQTNKNTNAPRMVPPSTTEKELSIIEKFAEIYPRDAQRFGYHVPNPSGIERDSSKKEFCTHWIKTGECAFTAIGCKYKHEMPGIVKLREIGFREVPRWWKDKTALAARGPTWIERRAAQCDVENSRLTNESKARREFDPSKFKTRLDIGRNTPSDDMRQKRSHLRRETKYDQNISSTKSSVVQNITDSDSSVPRLLIEIDDVPASPTSQQLSNTSLASIASDSTETSSSNSHLLSEVDDLKAVPISLAVRQTISKHSIVKPGVTRASPIPAIRRNSEISWSSISADDVEPFMLTRELKNAANSTSKTAAESTKPYGLQLSKYAAISHPEY